MKKVLSIFTVIMTAVSCANPFLSSWDTPYGIPDFGKIKEKHYIPAIKEACDAVFADKFPYGFGKGRFMRSNFTLSDYAKYGVVEDDRILGMSDPKSKQRPTIIQGTK